MCKYALVTGTDYGLGYELVKQLLYKGYVVFAGCYLDNNDQYKELSEEYIGYLNIVKLDISSIDSVMQVREYILKQTKHLDLLINNAGILGDYQDTIEDELNFEDIEQVINVNAIGTLKVTQTMFPLLLKGDDKLIVTISSEAGSITDSSRNAWFGYCMSKSALNMEAELIHNQFKKYNGQVMLVHPGWMQTYMRGTLDIDADITPEFSAKNIIKLIDNKEQYRGEKAVYIDYLGNKINW